jgi:uncharacterized protein (TIGR02271 family)
MIESQQLDRLPGMDVIGSDGEDIGKVDEVYVDDATGEPSFALVNTGLFGLKSSFVPLDQAALSGENLQVAATKDQVKDAPNMDPDGHLSPDEEDELYRYYGLEAPSAHRTTEAEYTQTSGTAGTTETAGTARTEGTADVVDRSETAGTAATAGTAGTAGTDENVHGTAGRDTSGPTTDDAMTRSEEEVEITKRERPAGKARLRKHIVTEHVTKTVPVEREEVVIEREPIDEANIDDATEGPALSEEEHEVELTEEVVEVDKRTVPKERVRLDKETHVDEETVEEDVAKEEIDLAGLEESRQDKH